MATITVDYSLSTAGQKAAIRAGHDASYSQQATISDPEHTMLDHVSIDGAGRMSLKLTRYSVFISGMYPGEHKKYSIADSVSLGRGTAKLDAPITTLDELLAAMALLETERQECVVALPGLQAAEDADYPLRLEAARAEHSAKELARLTRENDSLRNTVDQLRRELAARMADDDEPTNG